MRSKDNGKMMYTIFASLFVVVLSQYHHHDIALLIDSTFKYVDVNPTDGLLEKSELARAFEDLDANKDGQLVYTEYIKYTHDSQLQHDLFNHFDTNKDGVIQRTEYVDENFSKMDHNGDSEVSRTDYDHYFTNVVQHLMHHGHNGR
uniref:Uncharacterized protein LOC111113282 n=1 Tax=Crassostrea virginica TaxID=6565 RepID=A0A8B8BUS9_CRAVI|nr:uncharacterized protein LOC111113282 [Crassostrea virginica]